jgi:Chromate resistance exported protein
MMKWITRTGIRVNRTGACWLIRRFLDPEAEFLFVPAEQDAESQAASGATGFDAPALLRLARITIKSNGGKDCERCAPGPAIKSESQRRRLLTFLLGACHALSTHTHFLPPLDAKESHSGEVGYGQGSCRDQSRPAPTAWLPIRAGWLGSPELLVQARFFAIHHE